MAKRPVFLPLKQKPYVEVKSVDFTWHAGFAVSQKQKSVRELHDAAKGLEVCKSPIEISSKGDDEHGVAMSAFNLVVELEDGLKISLENIFQSSKVFERGGPFRDLLKVSPLEAKRDPRLKEHGDLVAFRGRKTLWPIEPKTLFYDWIYLNALKRNPHLADYCMQFDAFTDIEFNPDKSFNCQARSVALYVSLRRNGLLEILEDETAFRSEFSQRKNSDSIINVQQSLL